MIYKQLHRNIKIEQQYFFTHKLSLVDFISTFNFIIKYEMWISLNYNKNPYNIIHLLTGYEGNSTFIVPKVPAIFRGNAEENSWYRGKIKVLLPEYQVYKGFIILNNCAIQNSKF